MTVGFNVWLGDLMNFPKIDWWGIPLGIVCLPDFTGKRDKDRIADRTEPTRLFGRLPRLREQHEEVLVVGFEGLASHCLIKRLRVFAHQDSPFIILHPGDDDVGSFFRSDTPLLECLPLVADRLANLIIRQFWPTHTSHNVLSELLNLFICHIFGITAPQNLP